MSSSFCEKYRPKNVSEIIGDANITNTIIKWLQNFTKEQYKCMLIIGPHGSGKSCRLDVALKNLNYKPYFFNNIKNQLMDDISDKVDKKEKVPRGYDKKNISDKKDSYRFLNQLSSGMDILSLMNAENAKRYAIIIDEMDMELLAHDKKDLIKLMKINNLHSYCPIIFVFDTKHNKLITSLKKGTKEVRLFEPCDMDMMKLLQRIVSTEKITLGDCEISNNIIEFAQHDFRRLCTTMYDLINDCCNSNSITQETLDEYSSMMCEKHLSFDIYRASNMLLTGYKNIDECLKLYETEKVNIPLMVQHNYIYKIIHFNENKNTSQLLKYITNALSFGDVVDNYIYGEQRWELQTIHGLFSCGIPAYHLDTYPKTYSRRPEYPVDMNKTSTKRLNKKKINDASKIFESIDPLDYIYIGKIICTLISTNKMDDVIEIAKNYKLTLDDIEDLLKIDKNAQFKINLTAKQKRLLKDLKTI